MLLGAPCPQTTLCQHQAPVLAGLRTAALWLAEGRADNILLGAVDESSALLEETARRLQDPASPALPLSEGAVFFLLHNRGNGRAQVCFDAPEIPDTPYCFGRAGHGGSLERLVGEIPVSGAFYLAAAALAVENSGQAALCYDGQHPVCVGGRV